MSSVCLILLDARAHTHKHIPEEEIHRGSVSVEPVCARVGRETRVKKRGGEIGGGNGTRVRRTTTRARVAPVVITQPGARNRDTPRSSHAHQPAFDVTGGPASASATTSPSSAPASSWTDVHCAEDGDVSVPVARAYPPPPPPFSTLPCPLSIHLLARFVQREPLSLSLYVYTCVCVGVRVLGRCAAGSGGESL